MLGTAMEEAKGVVRLSEVVTLSASVRFHEFADDRVAVPPDGNGPTIDDRRRGRSRMNTKRYSSLGSDRFGILLVEASGLDHSVKRGDGDDCIYDDNRGKQNGGVIFRRPLCSANQTG